MRAAFRAGTVDSVIIVQYVFENSDTATVQMKDRASGRSGMMSFVAGILRGLSG